ncbi:MAG TPA: hypothetical protein PK156_45425 [Polyangium sp.]|nr:hypothetical protein [Polyangium sp.]
MPSLKQTGQCVLEIPADEQIALLLSHARKSHRLSFLLMSDAGLRPYVHFLKADLEDAARRIAARGRPSPT